MKEKKVQPEKQQIFGGAPVSSENPSVEKLLDADKAVLDMVKMKRALALANAEKALAQNEVAELAYSNIVLQLTIKYSLTDKDVITESGEIQRNVKKGE